MTTKKDKLVFEIEHNKGKQFKGEIKGDILVKNKKGEVKKRVDMTFFNFEEAIGFLKGIINKK